MPPAWLDAEWTPPQLFDTSSRALLLVKQNQRAMRSSSERENHAFPAGISLLPPPSALEGFSS